MYLSLRTLKKGFVCNPPDQQVQDAGGLVPRPGSPGTRLAYIVLSGIMILGLEC